MGIDPNDIIYSVSPDGELALGQQFEKVVRDIAREEVASLCGLVLRRVGIGESKGVSRAGRALEPLEESLVAAFAEALVDFGKSEDAPGG